MGCGEWNEGWGQGVEWGEVGALQLRCSLSWQRGQGEMCWWGVGREVADGCSSLLPLSSRAFGEGYVVRCSEGSPGQSMR